MLLLNDIVIYIHKSSLGLRENLGCVEIGRQPNPGYLFLGSTHWVVNHHDKFLRASIVRYWAIEDGVVCTSFTIK
jgi:hypothetical protein